MCGEESSAVLFRFAGWWQLMSVNLECGLAYSISG